MAAISALHYAKFPSSLAQSHSADKNSASSTPNVGFTHSVTLHSQLGSKKSPLSLHSPFTLFGSQRSKMPSFVVYAAADQEDEWGGEKSSDGSSAATSTATTPAVKEEDNETSDLKRALVDSFYGTERGLRASSETRAEIVELITQLEAKNPTPAPTEALSLLSGKWILVYTSFSELFPLLAAGTLPLVKVKEISQKFDAETLTVENYVQFAGPLATTSFSTNATFEVRSPKRVQIKFEEGIISTPQLTDNIEIPDSVEFLGQKIDLAPFRGVISSVQVAASSVVRTISEQPPIKFPIRTDRAQSWLLTTYLDEDLRISRADGSSVFVLIKEGSLLMPPP